MPLHEDRNWELPTDMDWARVPVALLMDIRRELKTLNKLLHCYRFVGIPNQLEKIARNTTKPRRRRKKS